MSSDQGGDVQTARCYLVTGGSSGIGAMVAGHLSARGHRVWITGTRHATVEPVVVAGSAEGGSAVDAADRVGMRAAFAEAVTALGGLDGVFLNAGIDGEGRPATQLSLESFAEVLRVNTIGVLNGAQLAHEFLARPGRIVVNASANALRPERDFADYNASKAAAVSLAQTLALEWGAEGLSVCAICPGYFPSRMTAPYLDDPDHRAALVQQIPIGRFGEPIDVGSLVEFLLSPSAGYLNGSVITLDGGASI